MQIGQQLAQPGIVRVNGRGPQVLHLHHFAEKGIERRMFVRAK
jgi:hypothetical protein